MCGYHSTVVVVVCVVLCLGSRPPLAVVQAEAGCSHTTITQLPVCTTRHTVLSVNTTSSAYASSLTLIKLFIDSSYIFPPGSSTPICFDDCCWLHSALYGGRIPVLLLWKAINVIVHHLWLMDPFILH